MNSLPRPYLNVTRLASTQRGIEQHLLVLHVDALDRADPGREGEDLRLAERLGGVPAAVRSQITGGLRHSSIVVQMEKVGAKS